MQTLETSTPRFRPRFRNYQWESIFIFSLKQFHALISMFSAAVLHNYTLTMSVSTPADSLVFKANGCVLIYQKVEPIHASFVCVCVCLYLCMHMWIYFSSLSSTFFSPFDELLSFFLKKLSITIIIIITSVIIIIIIRFFTFLFLIITTFLYCGFSLAPGVWGYSGSGLGWEDQLSEDQRIQAPYIHPLSHWKPAPPQTQLNSSPL